MPITEKRYPDWVQEYRTRGTTVKKRGDTYYLYKRTSRRVEGKKYPQPVDTYIGVITPDGVIPSNKRKVELTNAEVWEYGFSKALWELCPEGWKKPLGSDWEDVLSIIILKKSPSSYIQRERQIKEVSDFRYQFKTKVSDLNHRLCLKYGIRIDDLLRLNTIYLVCIDNHELISRVSEDQRVLLDKTGVVLGLC